MKSLAGIRTMLAVAVALTVVLAMPTGTASATPASPWYWTTAYMQQQLASTIDWGHGRVDTIRAAACYPVGGWQGPDATTRFHHFSCTLTPAKGARYVVVATPSSQTLVSVSWIRLATPSVWYWSTQKVANTLATEGVRWPTGIDRVLNDDCVSFGPSFKGNYQDFNCAVGTPRSASGSYGYLVLVHISGQSTYSVAYVGEDASAGPLSGGQSAISGSYDAGMTGMILSTAWWSNQIRFGTPFPHPAP